MYLILSIGYSTLPPCSLPNSIEAHDLLEAATRHVYGGRASSPEFHRTCTAKFARWMKSYRFRTQALLFELDTALDVADNTPLADLLLNAAKQKSSLWKAFHIVFPVPMQPTSLHGYVRQYGLWVQIVMEYRKKHPHGKGESLFQDLAAWVANGVYPFNHTTLTF